MHSTFKSPHQIATSGKNTTMSTLNSESLISSETLILQAIISISPLLQPYSPKLYFYTFSLQLLILPLYLHSQLVVILPISLGNRSNNKGTSASSYHHLHLPNCLYVHILCCFPCCWIKSLLHIESSSFSCALDLVSFCLCRDIG